MTRFTPWFAFEIWNMDQSTDQRTKKANRMNRLACWNSDGGCNNAYAAFRTASELP